MWRNQILIGHVLDLLQMLPSEYVHMAVTSPPYWGLRDYKLPPQVWDDFTGRCEHEWGEENNRNLITPRTERANWNSSDEYEENKPRVGGVKTVNISQGQFCIRCNAWSGSLGLEPTPELYTQHLVQIFRELRRVLRKDGTLWVVIGDSYAGSGGAHKPEHANPGISRSGERAGNVRGGEVVGGLKPKDLVGIPWRLFLALQADGWYGRCDAIWAKMNPMPESVNGWRWERHRIKMKAQPKRKSNQTAVQYDRDQSGGIVNAASAEYQDCPGCPKCTPHAGFVLRRGSWRPTRSHEYVFMLTKSAEYYGDREAVAEPHQTAFHAPGNKEQRRIGARAASDPARDPTRIWGNTTGRNKRSVWPIPDEENDALLAELDVAISEGIITKEDVLALLPPSNHENKRSVWTLSTQPFAEAHFAVYPERLIEPCILASTSAKGVCPECGAPWARVMEYTIDPERVPDKWKKSYKGQASDDDDYTRFISSDGGSISEMFAKTFAKRRETIGWRPSCGCTNLSERSGLTTSEVAEKLGKSQDPIPAIVFDPFMGSGTTAIVARRLGRDYLGIDLGYGEMQTHRLEKSK